MILTALAFAAAVQNRCTTLDARLPRALAGWTRGGAGLDTRHAVTLPARGGSAETRVTIRKPGTFGIAVDQQAWIDVYPAGRGRRALDIASEGRGVSCSTIRKIVRYRLRPGSYRVTVGKVAGARVKLMLVR